MPWAWLLNTKVLGAIAIAGVMAFGGIQSLRLNNAKRDQIDQATGKSWRFEEMRDGPELLAVQRNYATCDAALSRQNASVAALQAQSIADTQKATKAAQQASLASQTANKLAAQILAPHQDHSCAAAEALIRETVIQ